MTCCKYSLAWSTVAALALAIGCGGASTTGGGSDADKAKTMTGDVIRTASGAGVTAEAHEDWKEANKKFTKYEAEGWTPAACSDVMGDYEDAVEAQGGKFAEAKYMVGVTAERCGKGEEALAAFREALSQNPKLCGPRVAIGLDHLEQGRVSQAQQEFSQAVKDQPLACSAGYINLATIQRKTGSGNELDAAEVNLKRALAIESSDLAAYNQLALLHLKQAKLGKKPKLDLAEVECRQAQLIDADYAPIYNTWGLIKMERENIIEALRFFEKARQLDPKLFQAHMNFGAITHSFRGYADAKDAYSKAVGLHPDDYDAHIGLGAALRGLKDTNGAKAEYEKAISLDGARPDAYFNLGVLYHDYMSGSIQDLETAKKFFGQFVSRANGKGEFKEKIQDVTRTCKQTKGRSRSKCRPGRLQNINTALEALKEAASMQAG